MREPLPPMRDTCTPTPKPPTCRDDRVVGSELDELVDDYIARFREGGRAEREWYANVGSIEASIERATSCKRSDGKHHGHQACIPTVALLRFPRAVARLPIAESRDFDELHAHLEAAGEPIRGIGDLTVYDVASRIGHFLRLEPERVYLHRGTRDGARALGLDWRAKSLPTTVFPAEMQRLTAAEMEDFLCIYKEHLGVHMTERDRTSPASER